MQGESIPYVSDESAKMAMSFEERLQNVPTPAGFLFVSVTPTPVVGGRVTTFTIVVGIDRKIQEPTAQAVVKQVFAKEISDAVLNINCRIFRGSLGSANHPTAEKPSTIPC